MKYRICGNFGKQLIIKWIIDVKINAKKKTKWNLFIKIYLLRYENCSFLFC